MEPSGKCQMNYGLLPMKAYYFFYNAGSGAIIPYLSTYSRQLGLSSILVGYVLSLSPLAAMVAKIIFGGLSDRYMKLRFLFLLFQVISTIALLGINFIPEVPRESHLELHCHVLSVFKVCKPGLGNDDSILPKGIDRVKCQFKCDMDSPQWRTHVCNYWKIPQGCSVSEHPDAKISLSHLPFTGEISLNHTDVEKDCIFLRATHVFEGEQERIPFCNSSEILKSNCSARCDNNALNDLIDKPRDHVATTSQFIWFLFLTLIAWSSTEVDASLADTICFGLLGAKANKYGEQRVWGAIGWGLSTFATGALIDQFSGSGQKNYSVAFYGMLICMSLSFLVSYQIKYVQTKMSRSIWTDVRKVVFDCRVIMFLSCCIIMGMCTGLLWTFLFWHLEVLGEQAKLSAQWMKLLQGLTAGVQCLLGELPLFFLSGKIIKRLGHIHAITLVLMAMTLRLFLYAVLVNPWWVLPIELLQGFTFGLFYATIVSYGSMIAPPGTEATMQALVGASFGGIGVASGTMLAGWLYEAVGGSATFAIYGSGCIICCIAHLATNLRGKHQHYSAGTDSDASKQSASYASPMDAAFITDNADAM